MNKFTTGVGSVRSNVSDTELVDVLAKMIEDWGYTGRPVDRLLERLRRELVPRSKVLELLIKAITEEAARHIVNRPDTTGTETRAAACAQRLLSELDNGDA